MRIFGVSMDRWRKIGPAWLCIFMSAGLAAAAAASSLSPADLPDLMDVADYKGPLSFCGEQVPLNRQEVRERFEKELLLSVWDRPQAILWLKRSRRYLIPIQRLLAQNDLPEDLQYIAVAESALRPHAGSRKGAMGFWQFMKGTGRRYGLRIDERIDERRNVIASTHAAIDYLKDLHAIFGSWTLCAAAYNMGEDGLMSEILEQETDDYYSLYLPLETQRYVFRLLAAKLIMTDPAKYGFELDEDDYYPPLRSATVELDCFEDTPIRLVARAADARFKEIKDLNPEIRGYYLPRGHHRIQVPAGADQEFHKRFKGLMKKWSAEQEARIYVVQEGDTLSAIAERFGAPLSALLIWNHLNAEEPIHPGDRLVIRRGWTSPHAADSDKEMKPQPVQ
jgi:membrane-bound lytic murein transglycosylase D